MFSWLSWGPASNTTAVTSGANADSELGEVRSRLRSSASRPATHDQNLSKAHRELQLQLHTTGTIGIEARRSARLPVDFDCGDYDHTQHRRFNYAERALVWKPWLSGVHGRCAQLLLLVTIAICHPWIVSRTSNGSHHLLAKLGPPALAIVVAKSTVFITVQELRRTALHLPRLSQTAGLYQRYLLSHGLLTVLVLAPLLCIPVRPSTSFASVHWEALSPDCFTLDRLADHVQGHFPRAAYAPGRDPLLTHPNLAFSSWSASIDPTWQILPADADSNVSKSLDLDSVSDVNSDWLWGRARAGYAIKLPFFAPNILPRYPVSCEWRQEQKMLAASMACDEVELPLSLHNLSSDTKALSVHVVTADGCGASLSLSVQLLSSAQKRDLQSMVDKYGAFLASVANESVFDPYLSAKLDLFRPRLTQYAAYLNQPSASILPMWLPATAQRDGVSNSSCTRRYILGTPDVSFSAIVGSMSPIKIHAASCVVNYGLSERRGTFGLNPPWVASTKFWDVPFRQRGRPSSEVQLSDVEPGSQTYKSKPLKREDRFSSKVDEVLALELPTTRIFDNWYPLQLLEYEFLANSPAQQHSYHAIAYASDQFMLNIFQKITVAAGMLPRECESHVSSRRGSQTFTYLQEGTLQRQAWFRSVYWTSLCLAASLLLVCHVLADDSPSGLPWDVASIAARAALLSGSSLLKHFAGAEDVPESLRDLIPIRVRRWLRSDDHIHYSWRADTLLHRGKVRRDRLSFSNLRRHSFSSLPSHANPWVVVGLVGLLASALVGSFVATRFLRMPIDIETDASSLVPIVLGTEWRLSKPFWLELLLQIIPAVASISLTPAWWDMLTYFYKTRLPWAELFRPNVANKTLTLDYMNLPLPLFKALRNRHWMLTTLIMGSVLILPLPFLAANAIDTEWSLENGQIFAASKSWAWRRDMLSSNDSEIMRDVLQDSLLALRNASVLPKWASYRTALIPYTFGPTDTQKIPTGYAVYWELETETIRADLQCGILKSEPLFEVGSPQRRQSDFKGLKVRLHENHSNYDGSKYLLADSCFSQETDRGARSNMFCSHWELRHLPFGGSTAGMPIWIISAARFAGTLKSAYALSCVPRILAGKGKTKLLSMTGSLDDAFIHAHIPTEETLLKTNMAGEYSKLLNSSAFTPDVGTEDWLSISGLRFDSPVVQTPGFRGDILSFPSHQEIVRNRLDPDNATLLAELSSLAFSTTFSIAAHTTNLLKVPIRAESIPVIAQVMRERRADSAFILPAIAYICVLALVMATHIVVMYGYREYRFPFEPEAVENTWFFLYRSRVIHSIKRVQNPQRLSLKSFYARVEGLGAKYVFRPAADPVTGADVMVDIVDGSDTGHGTDPMDVERGPLLDGRDSLDQVREEEEEE